MTEISENTNGTFGYSFDISEMEEGKIYIQATACDNAGNISDSVVGEFIVDRTQPDEITDLVSETGNGNVHLVWTVTSDDTEKFLIYRSEGELNSYSLIAECSTKDYYDITAKLGTLYSYKVIAVDTAGNKSEYSNEAIAQITEDNIVPRLLGFNYKSGTSVSTTPKMSVVAWDNFALSSATVEYKPKDASNGIWYEIGTFDLSSNYAAADFTWNTDGLDDGIYEFRAYCTDLMGNTSNTFTAEFTLDATAPDAPVLELLQKDFLIELKWSEPEADDIDCYKVYRKDSKNKNFELLTQTTTPAYSDTDVEPYKTYTYMVEVYDKVGNFTASNEMNGYAFDNDTVAPIIDIPDELYGIAGEEILIDGSACSDNVRIKRFIWDMGDGNTIYGMKNVYTYDDSGEYTVTLTVEDSAGNKAEKDIAVTVYEPSEYGFINIEVTDSNNNPLSYSYIYVYSGDSEGVHTMRTGYDGTLKLCVPIGDNKIAAYKDGYLPEEKEIVINNEGDNGTAKLALQSGELVTGNLEVHRMSLEEMAEAGIDFNDPQNYHTVKFSVKLTFAQEPIPTIIEYIYTGNGSYISGGGTGVKASQYKEVFKHLASWGFVVVGNEDDNSRTGESSAATLEFILGLHADKNSNFYGKIDTENIGIAGHSQGGVGTINAVTEQSNGIMYKAIWAASTTSRYHADEMNKNDDGWSCNLSNIHIPIFMVAGTKDFDAGNMMEYSETLPEGKVQGICPLWWLNECYDSVSDDVDKVIARQIGKDHGDMLRSADGYMTAWFMYYLQGDTEAGNAFFGEDSELLSNENWQDIKINP